MLPIQHQTITKLRKSALLVPLVCLFFSLTGCGFHPIYGARDDNKPVTAELNDVGIDSIPNRNGQMLRNDLIDRMYHDGRPQNPKYELAITLRETEEGIGLLPNATSSLTELNLYADYVLKDRSGKEVVRATAHAVATFNQLQQEYGTLAASENAYQRCIDQVSDQILDRVSLYFSEGNIIKPPAVPKEKEQELKIIP